MEEFIDHFKEDHHYDGGSRIPKHEKKYGYLTRKLISNGEIDDVPDDRTGLPANSQEYSLNKKGRWNLLDVVRNEMKQLNEDNEDLKVSALEKDTAFFCRKSIANTKAYHSIDENGEISHRYSSQTYANERTLVEQPKPPKKKGKGRRRGVVWEQQNETFREDEEGNLSEQDDGQHVRYEIVTPCQSSNLYEKAKHQHYKHTGNGSKRNFSYTQLQRRGVNNVYDDWEVDNDGVINEDCWQDLMDALYDDYCSSEVEEMRPTPSYTNIADFIEMDENKKQQQKKMRRKRNRVVSDSELAVNNKGRFFVYEMDDECDYEDGSETVQITTENVVLPVVRTEVSTLSNFKMVPTETTCRSDNLTVEFLQEHYGCTYYECACLPRRFCIDISGRVRNVLHSYHPTASTFDIQAVCIFEIVPKRFLQVECESETSQIRVWLNGVFTNDLQSLALGTLNPCEIHTIETVIESATKMFLTLPVESFLLKEFTNSPMTLNRLFDAPARLLGNELPHCLKVAEANEVVLKKGDLARKLQRQITAVESYVWSDIGENSCGICYEWPVENAGFCLASCQHWFCNSCWQMYCSDRIRNGFIPVKCPDSKCDTVMDYDILTTVLPLPQCILFANQYRDRYVGANSNNWIWCPNIKCGRIIYFENLRSSSVCACVCGELWCAQCTGSVHWPATCEQAAIYLTQLKRNGDFNGRVTYGKIKFVEVRRCPHCFLPMEKGEGCNHMTCRCGNAFCWYCGRKWNAGTDHGNCKKVAQLEKVKLVDRVPIKNLQFWSDELYQRCIAHRFALEPSKLRKLKHLVLSSVKNPKQLNEILTTNEKLSSDTNLNPVQSSTNPDVISKSDDTRDFVASFFEHYYQCHYLLEYSYLWMQWLSNKSEKSAARRFYSLADRLNFTITRLDDVCVSGNLTKIVEAMDLSKKLLKKVIDEINSIKAKQR